LPATETRSDVVEDRGHRFGDLISGCGRAIRAAASGIPADLAQLVLDAAQVTNDRGNARVKVPRTMLKHLLLFRSDLCFAAADAAEAPRSLAR
jgi:hypothetical protein